jgi:protein ImuA
MSAMSSVISPPTVAAASPGRGSRVRLASAAKPMRGPRAPMPSPDLLHPALWLGDQLGRHVDRAVASGFPQLDRQLPGGGWPRRVLTELLLPHPGVGEIRLLSHSLAALQREGRLVMLFDPPQQLSAWALAQCGLDVEQLLVIQTRCKVVAGSDSLWALEQALKSGHVGAVVAWLPPRLRAERLRRLQLAAQAHDGPAFVLRETAAQQRPTAAPLRLALRAGGADTLQLRLLKRRGPPLETPLQLELPSVLSEAARGRAEQIRVPATASPMWDGFSAGLPAATFINLAS